MVPLWAVIAIPFNMIYGIAQKHGVDPLLVAAMVWKESRGDCLASRHEAHYNDDWLVEPEKYARKFLLEVEHEKYLQKTSWGYMQVMGATARWLGFTGQHPKLTQPNVGLEYGCKYLKRQLDRYKVTTDAIAAYNAGSVRKNGMGQYINADYVRDVMGYYKELAG